MHVPEIIKVKEHLKKLKTENNIVSEWELPYENILTRLSAAIFFLTPKNEADEPKIWEELKAYPGFDYRANEEKKLSKLQYRITFNKGMDL